MFATVPLVEELAYPRRVWNKGVTVCHGRAFELLTGWLHTSTRPLGEPSVRSTRKKDEQNG